MQVNTGAPSAEDLEYGRLVWIAIYGHWHLAKVVDINGCKRLQPISGGFTEPLRVVSKWAHCEGPVESAEL